jgi:alkanesulfonate monooxygenase SsuD/methylene tetrahydromethanopterin reductase-like flavin-dependent oxidoreductase (luciferase family)
MIEIGIDSFAATFPDPRTGQVLPPATRMANLLAEIETADRSGVDVFGIGEHHRAEFLDAAPVVILSAAAARTERIRLTSAVTVLSAADPVRVFQDFATLDLISNGRAEIVAGRGSSVEAFPLFGFDLNDYDELFVEKLGLLLELRGAPNPIWRGRYRAPLSGQGVFPRSVQDRLPVWLGVGGTPQSFVRAGELGLPLMVAIIGGTFERFRPLVDLYREAGRRAGHSADVLRVGVHSYGFVGETERAHARRFTLAGITSPPRSGVNGACHHRRRRGSMRRPPRMELSSSAIPIRSPPSSFTPTRPWEACHGSPFR